MSQRPSSPLDVRHEERWRTVAFARLQSGPNVGRCVAVVEFSETGCRMRDHSMPCEVGDTFHLMLEDVGPLIGDVVWKSGAFFGVSFRRALTAPLLAQLQATLAQPLAERLARMIHG